MPKARLVFDGDNVYIGKDARIYWLKDDIASKIDEIPWVINSLDSTSTTDALSANMGRTLQDQINWLSWTWKFLSTWDCTTWLPGTNPQEDPYTYKVWDYYVVSATGSTNYKPHWSTYTQWVPSTTVELENVWVNDKYYFDWADWVRIPDTAIQISIDSALSTTSTNAVENRAIATAINWKQDIIPDLSAIRNWATAWTTALQPNDNISQLTNNVGYQTAGDVNAAIQSAIWQLPTVNDWVLTIQKNSTTIDTFSANSANNKTINIPVPTTVAELSDASDYATKTYVDDAIDWLIHEWGTAPQNPHEWDLWYDTVNHVLKIYNWTTWETVDTDTDTRYTAWNGINISAQNEISIDTSVVATKSDLNSKQDTLVSWTNIKTINNQSLLWSWDIMISPWETPNVKVFTISWQWDTTTWQQIYDYYKAWNTPLLKYNNVIYKLTDFSTSWTDFDIKFEWLYAFDESSSYSRIDWYTIIIFGTSDVVSDVAPASFSLKYLATDSNYIQPYTPQYAWSPATKKYVDDIVWDIESLLANL